MSFGVLELMVFCGLIICCRLYLNCIGREKKMDGLFPSILGFMLDK